MSVDDNGDVLMNGRLGGSLSSPQSSKDTVSKQSKAPEFVPVESNNWLIHSRYVRKEFDICQLIIEEDLARTKGCNEYANYILGMIYQHQGKVREALECFQKCCFLNPRSTSNIRLLGRSWFLLGQRYQAIEAFTKAEKLATTPEWSIFHNLAPEFVPVESNNWLIHSRYVRKEFDICQLIIEEDLARTKGCNEYANYILGMIYQHQGKVREALECFQKCCFLNPRSTSNIRLLGRSWFLLGQRYQAIEAFTKAEKLATTPEWSIFHNLGICYASLGRVGKAREYLTKAVHLGRTQVSYEALSSLYVTENDINSALDLYQVALELFPSSWEIATALGQLYMQFGETAKAFNYFGQALAINRTATQPLLGIASICQEENDFDVALSKYKIAGQQLPESVCLWNNMGLCFLGKGKHIAAISCLKRANYLDPMDWKSLHNLGLVHIHTKQYASAFHFLSSAIKLENRNALSFMLLAIVLQRLSFYDNATKCFEQAVKLDADDPTIRINYISHLYSMNLKEAALEQLNLVQRLMQSADVNDKTNDAVKQLTAILTRDLIVPIPESSA